ncbi:AAA domain-containing protein [Kribbella sp. NPDC050124]|uniref:AAA domain-containing protein n=1 Tax=Kribbella sp. NPDC050124 TaxID=3364114 RepID=UPI0037ADEA2F
MPSSADNARLDLVRAKAEEWAASLIDLGPRNTLLHFRDTKTASLDLTRAAPESLRALLTGTAVTMTRLYPDPEAHRDACMRAKNIKRRIVALEEEQGISAGRIAHGLLAVSTTRRGAGGRPVPPLRAPVLLRSVDIQAKTVSESDYSLRVGDEVDINPVLLYSLTTEYGASFDLDDFHEKVVAVLGETTDPAEQLEQTYRVLHRVLGMQPITVELERRVAIGLFSYEKLPMVEDLRRSTELLAANDVIAALAGDKLAERSLLDDDRDFAEVTIDDLAPADEILVQDADSSQERAIAAALSGRNVLIEGPPGTGKSQAIANIIAGATGRGLKVLFVAEKRAAIEAVTQRLAAVDLDGLVLDLHQQKLNKRQLAQQLTQSLDRAALEPAVRIDESSARYIDRRQRVVRYAQELHSVRQPWGLSAYRTLEASFTLTPGVQTRLRFRGSGLRVLSAETIDIVTRDLREYIEAGGVRVQRGESPWSRAIVRTTEDIENVLAELDGLTRTTLRQSTRDMEWLLQETGLVRPSAVSEWQDVLELLGSIERSVADFGEDVFKTDLHSLYLATADRSVRKAEGAKLSFGTRRKLIKQVRSMSRRGVKARRDLHRELLELRRHLERWRELAGDESTPMTVNRLGEITSHYRELRDQLAAVALCTQVMDLDQRPAEDVESQLAELDSDQDTLWRVPRLTELREGFEGIGLGPLLAEVAERRADADEAAAILRYAWIHSLLDQFKIDSGVLREFVAKSHDRTVAEFGAADTGLRDLAPRRVRREIARRLSEACDEHPDQSQLVRAQAARKTGHMALRKLVEAAPDVLLAVRPCWAMSPLLVSKTLPAARLFDIVIFDEASQILPQDAVTSIVRGRRIVVAGDDRQLPPSSYFQRVLAGADEESEDDDGTGGLTSYESILARLTSLLPNRHLLRWHYRSRDERLIAFSNHEIYNDDLVTFPGVLEGAPISLDVVDGIAQPGQDGSAPAEVDKVVERILEHAEDRPEESLGVIAMSQKHADRIDMALRQELKDRPQLAEFFGDTAGVSRRFFIKNLERVQGDERDAIILSIGYAKRSDGRVLRNFGPLIKEGGQRRLNVAVTRAKRRMTVVSSFSAADLAPKEEPTGDELLRRFLEFAALGGDLGRVGRLVPVELNGLEASIQKALVESGVPVYPQWGFSDGYRIDFALGHPEQPGRMVLAVEADGEKYHQAHSARDRDRLRQSHLENLGWKFHRLWSTAWFANAETELEKILESWRLAMKEPEPVGSPAPDIQPPVPQPVSPSRSLAKPWIQPGADITDYTEQQLVDVFRWLLSDELHVIREVRIEQAMRELGFKRRGKRIVGRLTEALEVVINEGKGHA